MDHSEAGKLGAVVSREVVKHHAKIRRETYLLDPKYCANPDCGKIIPFELRLLNRFCGHKCAAIITNSCHGAPRTAPRCVVCDIRHDMNGERCRKHEIDYQISLGHIHERKTLKRWLVRERGYACERCGGSEWMGAPMPLELDHADGNPANDKPNNIRLLCSNCHSQMPNAKGKNRGNGRKARGLLRH